MSQTRILTSRTRRLLDIQGFDTVDAQELAPVAPWLRLAFGLCALLGGVGTVLASPTILLVLAPVAVDLCIDRRQHVVVAEQVERPATRAGQVVGQPEVRAGHVSFPPASTARNDQPSDEMSSSSRRSTASM